MIPESLARIEEDLRIAVESQRYEDVQRLAVLFCQSATGHVRELPPRGPEVKVIADRVQEVLHWTILMARTARASYAAELRRVVMLNKYLHHVGATPANMQVDV